MNFEAIFQTSYERLIGGGVGITDRGRRFFHRFYQNFLASSAQVRDKFQQTDMDRQVLVLQKGLYHLISFYVTRTDNEYTHQIALSHSKAGYDISPELYELWLESLVQTLEEMDPQYEPVQGLAWRMVMMPGILYMQHHYEDSAKPMDDASQGH